MDHANVSPEDDFDLDDFNTLVYITVCAYGDTDIVETVENFIFKHTEVNYNYNVSNDECKGNLIKFLCDHFHKFNYCYENKLTIYEYAMMLNNLEITETVNSMQKISPDDHYTLDMSTLAYRFNSRRKIINAPKIHKRGICMSNDIMRYVRFDGTMTNSTKTIIEINCQMVPLSRFIYVNCFKNTKMLKLVRVIDLRYCRNLLDIDISDLQHLEKLTITNSYLTGVKLPLGKDGKSGNYNKIVSNELKYIDVSKNKLNNLNLSMCKKLEYLNISDNNIQHLNLVGRIKYLCLSNNHGNLLSNIKYSPVTIKSLTDLNICGLNYHHRKTIKLPHFPNLKTLQVNRIFGGPNSIGVLRLTGGQLEEYRYIDISDNYYNKGIKIYGNSYIVNGHDLFLYRDITIYMFGIISIGALCKYIL